MPNRVIKESICTSDTLDQLSAEEERFFYRLTVQVDDFGLMDARPAIVRAACFPLKIETLPLTTIAGYLVALQRVGLIEVYRVDGRPYLHVTTWDKHQRRRAQFSKYPLPSAAQAQEQLPLDVPDIDVADPVNPPLSSAVNCQQPLSIAAETRGIETRGIEESRHESCDDAAAPSSPAETEPVNRTFEVACVLAEVCRMDLTANKGRLLKDAKALVAASPPATAELLRAHYGRDSNGWWWVNDWRGKKHEYPQPATIRETWGRWTAAPPNRDTGSNTHGQRHTANNERAALDRGNIARQPTEAERSAIEHALADRRHGSTNGAGCVG